MNFGLQTASNFRRYSSPAVTDARRDNPPTLNMVIVALTAISLYLNLPLLGVPGSMAILGGIILLGIHCVQQHQARVIASGLVVCTSLWIITIPFSPDPTRYGMEQLKSVALLMGSTLSAYGMFLELSTWPRKILLKCAIAISSILFLLSALEIYTPFRAISDEARRYLYSGRYLYEDDARDILFSGTIRPKVFTQEPSHLAKALAVTISASVVLSRHRYRVAIGLLAWLAAYRLVTAPTLLLGLGVIIASVVFKTPRAYSVTGLLVRIAAVAIPIAGFVWIQDLASLLPFARAQAIASGADRSFVIRSIGPATIAWETITRYPISGSGIGGREAISPIVLEFYGSLPGFWIERFRLNAGAGWGNAFFEIFTYSGIVTGAIVLPALLWVTRQFSSSALFSALLFFLVFNFDAGFTSSRPWIYYAILAASFAASYGQASRRPRSDARFAADPTLALSAR